MKIFLSYPSEQLETARDVYAFLTSLEVDVWFDKESLVAGQDWAREISKAQTEADLIVQICSTEIANKTGVIQKELKETLELLKLRPLGSLYLICMKTDEANLPPELIKFQHITYSDKNWKVNLVRSLLSKFK